MQAINQPNPQPGHLSLAARLAKTQVSTDNLTKLAVHFTTVFATANMFIAATTHPAVPGRPMLAGAKFFQTRYPVDSVIFVPVSFAEDGTPNATSQDFVMDAALIMLKPSGPTATTFTIVGFEPAHFEDSAANTIGRVGDKVFVDSTTPIKGVAAGDAVVHAILEHAAEGNARAVPLAPPPADGSHAALLEMMASGHNATTRTLFKKLVAMAPLFEHPDEWNKIFAIGADEGVGTAKDFTPQMAIAFFKNSLRNLQRDVLDPKTDIYSDKDIWLIYQFLFGDSGDDKVSLRAFNLTPGYDPKSKSFDLATAQQCTRTFTKFLGMTHGQNSRLAAMFAYMVNGVLDSVDFDPTDGARFLLLVHHLLSLVPSAPTQCALCVPPKTPFEWLADQWTITRNSRVIVEHEQTYVRAQLRELKRSAGGGPKTSATEHTAFTPVTSKKTKRGANRESTPERAPPPKPATPRRASVEEIRAWNAKRPAFLGPDEKVMCKQVANGQQCTNPRCRSNDAYTNDDLTKMAAVRAWAKKSPFGK